MGSTQQAQLSQHIIWRPNAGPQERLVNLPDTINEVLYGGARGGGKTDGMLGKHAIKASKYGKAVIGVFFRKTREDLKEAIQRSQDIYGPIGARYSGQGKQWVFPNGARLKFEYLSNDTDAQNYQGHNYSDLYFEELQNWGDPTPINKLRATLRAPGIPCQFHATANPGGPGHQWVKTRYIDPAPDGWKVLWEDFEDPFTGEVRRLNRLYIPSKITDNPHLGPQYVATLQQTGSQELVKAWLLGDWSVIDGAFFDNWSNDKHVIRPFKIPDDWHRFRSMDWGSAKPFSVGWWAVVTDDYPVENMAGKKVILPRGALIRYREWYGVKKDLSGITVPNVGVKMTAEQVAEGIKELEHDDRKVQPDITGVIDPATNISDGGPSIRERLHKCGVSFYNADNKRVPSGKALGGWDQLRARLEGEGGRPMLYAFSTCVDLIRTLPALQHDEKRPEDVNTDQEDHAPDEARYAVMSRPYTRPSETPDKPIDAQPTVGNIMDDHFKRMKRLRESA